MLQINDFRLRNIEKTDLKFIKEVRSSEEVQRNVGHHLFLNDDLQMSWFNNVIVNPHVLYALFEKKVDSEWITIGYVRITEIDHLNKSMCVGGDISEEHRGKKLGYGLYNLILHLGFNIWAMNRLWLLVLEKNKRAYNLYEKIGFKKEGVQRKAVFKEGSFENYIMMSILREEYYDTII